MQQCILPMKLTGLIAYFHHLEPAGRIERSLTEDSVIAPAGRQSLKGWGSVLHDVIITSNQKLLHVLSSPLSPYMGSGIKDWNWE